MRDGRDGSGSCNRVCRGIYYCAVIYVAAGCDATRENFTTSCQLPAAVSRSFCPDFSDHRSGFENASPGTEDPDRITVSGLARQYL